MPWRSPRALRIAPVVLAVAWGLAPVGATEARATEPGTGEALASEAATHDLRWLGHEHVIDIAAHGARQLTLGSEGLAILWEQGRAIAWQQVPGARHGVAAADGSWRIVGETHAWRFDADLASILEHSSAARPVACVGAPVLWWWEGDQLRVEDARVGADSRAPVATPETLARCSVSPDGAALTWFTEDGATVASTNGQRLRVVAHDFASDANPVAIPTGDSAPDTDWAVVPRMGDLVRSCDAFTRTGEPASCAPDAVPSAAATLPRTIRVHQWVDTPRYLFAIDASGWSYLSEAGGNRVAPPGWRTYGVLPTTDLVVGCQTTATSATLQTRSASGAEVASFRLPTGACPHAAWVDHQRAAVTTQDAVVEWLPDQRRWQSHARGQAVQASAPFGALQTRLEIREAWSPMCGAHRVVWRIRGEVEEPLELGVACADWATLSPVLHDGALLGARVEGELAGAVELGAERDGSEWGDAVMPARLGLVITTAGWLVETPEGVWMSEALRRFAVVRAGDDVVAGAEVVDSPAWVRHGPRWVREQRSASP